MYGTVVVITGASSSRARGRPTRSPRRADRPDRPRARRSRGGAARGGPAADPPPIGVTKMSAISIAAARSSIRGAPAPAPTDGRGQCRRRRGGRSRTQRRRLPARFEPHVDECVDPSNGETECDEVAGRPSAQGGEQDHRQEFDRRDGAKGQPGDCDVETCIHRGKHKTERDDQPPDIRSAGTQRAPWPPPGGKDQAGTRINATPSGSTPRREAPRKRGRGSGRSHCRQRRAAAGSPRRASPLGGARAVQRAPSFSSHRYKTGAGRTAFQTRNGPVLQAFLSSGGQDFNLRPPDYAL
jgi:hypothetical protein